MSAVETRSRGYLNMIRVGGFTAAVGLASIGGAVVDRIAIDPQEAQAATDANMLKPDVSADALKEATRQRTDYGNHISVSRSSSSTEAAGNFDPVADAALATRPEVLQARVIFDQHDAYQAKLGGLRRERGLNSREVLEWGAGVAGVILTYVGGMFATIGVSDRKKMMRNASTPSS